MGYIHLHMPAQVMEQPAFSLHVDKRKDEAKQEKIFSFWSQKGKMVLLCLQDKCLAGRGL